jgi:hypothetical protein
MKRDKLVPAIHPAKPVKILLTADTRTPSRRLAIQAITRMAGSDDRSPQPSNPPLLTLAARYSTDLPRRA